MTRKCKHCGDIIEIEYLVEISNIAPEEDCCFECFSFIFDEYAPECNCSKCTNRKKTAQQQKKRLEDPGYRVKFRERINLKRRKRYKEDVEYREKCNKSTREWHQKNRLNKSLEWKQKDAIKRQNDREFKRFIRLMQIMSLSQIIGEKDGLANKAGG